MAAKPGDIVPPRLADIELGTLETVDASSLKPGQLLEYVRLVDASLAGLDLAEIVIQDSEWRGIQLDDTNLARATISDSVLENLAAASLMAPRATLRNCLVKQSRAGSVILAGAELRGIRFEGCKLGFVDLTGADIADVEFSHCIIDELDVSDAKLKRVRFVDTRAETLTLGTAECENVDLRTLDLASLRGVRSLKGVIIDEFQLQLFAPDFVGLLGGRVG